MAAPLARKKNKKALVSVTQLIALAIIFALVFIFINISALRRVKLTNAANRVDHHVIESQAENTRVSNKQTKIRETKGRQHTQKIPENNAGHKAAHQVTEKKEASVAAANDGIRYHVLFSTGCSVFQDWQSYIFFFHAIKSGQLGEVTRIASGCEGKDAESLQKQFKEQIEIMTPHKNVHIHLTPDYSHLLGEKRFVYFNKPYGVLHWLENVLGYDASQKKNKHDKDIIILLDPDQIITRPFTHDFSGSTEAWRPRGKDSPKHWNTIEEGPMAQQYGFHLQWMTKTNITGIAKPEELPSPVETMKRGLAMENFAAGPPYIATGKDFYKIVKKWAEFAIPTHKQYPFLLAEMFAYSLAAAHLNMPHQLSQSFMVSDISSGKMEGWVHLLDKYNETDMCTEGAIPQDQLPHVLHYCQRYMVGKWFIGKYKLPKDFISCHSPLLMEPPPDVAARYDYYIQPGDKTHEKKVYTDKKHPKRAAFFLCRFIAALNEAATFYKEHNCNDGEPANMEKTLTFFDSMEDV